MQNPRPTTSPSRSLHGPIRTPTLRASLAAIAALGATQVHAVENGSPITPPGIYDFGSGTLPPVTDVGAFAIRAVSTRASTLRDGSGNVSPVKPRLKADALIFAAMKTTDKELLGGKFAYGIAVPVVLDSSLDLRIPTPAGTFVQSGENKGVGDVQLFPAVIQWQLTPQLSTNAGVMIQAPTGAYNKNRLINAGSNHWTIQPNFQFTYMTNGGLELSGSTQLNFNTRNTATDYRSGIELQQDFGIGQHVGDWTFGLAGYVYRQLTDDKNPNLRDGNRSRVNALGPAIGFFGPKHNLPVVYLHVYKEFGARNRTQGTQAAIRVSVAF